MTKEEYNNLPSCLLYKNPYKSCPSFGDDWDELEDPCQDCNGFKYNFMKYRDLSTTSVEDALKYMKE